MGAVARMSPLWSWALTVVGLSCFWLAGRKVWWAWYVGIAGQALWLTYSLLTQQWGFLAGVAAYTWVYVGNARRWTRERWPLVNEWGHPLRPLRTRIWHKVRYPGIPIGQYEMPPCPHDLECDQ
ncbi:MAG TPA: hypothetical protein PK478_03785 [Nitrospira sp.]|nr:hypothetical protein [Nitrospira sp.]